MLWAETGSGVWESTVFCFALVFIEWMWLMEGEYWTEYVHFLYTHTLHLSQVVACLPAFAVLHLRSNPSWNKEHMGAVFKFPHSRLKLSPTSFLLSLFKPRPIPHPIPFVEPFAQNRQHQSTSKFPFGKRRGQPKQTEDGGKEKKDVKQRLRAVMAGRSWCQLCYGWQTLKCLIHSRWGAGKHAATYCGDQTPCLNHRRRFMWL